MHSFVMAVVYTHHLEETRRFYEAHFVLPIEDASAQGFRVLLTGDSGIQYLDAGGAGHEATPGPLLRWKLPHTALERERLLAAGVPCSDLSVADWGAAFGERVQYFMFTDPSGVQIQAFESHFGEKRQFTTTADGVEVRKAQAGG